MTRIEDRDGSGKPINRRVLIIAKSYPPRPEIGGVRPSALVKYLPRFGWEPVVLTPRYGQRSAAAGNVVETEDEDGLRNWRRLSTLLNPRLGANKTGIQTGTAQDSGKPSSWRIQAIKGILSFPDDSRGWWPFALRAIAVLSKGKPFDAILTTAPPFSVHILGKHAKRLLRARWIADYRDLWSQSHYYPRGQLMRRFERSYEKRTLHSADALVTQSVSFAERLRQLHHHSNVVSITNGFDPEDYSELNDVKLSNKFTISHTGLLYFGKRDPSVLFQAVGQLCREGLMDPSIVRLQFFGPTAEWLSQRAQVAGVAECLVQAGQIPRSASMREQSQSQILLNLGWNHPDEAGNFPGKTFEYLGARRPILAIGFPEGVVSSLLRITGAGVHVTSLPELRSQLLLWYQEFCSKGQVSYRGVPKALALYSHERMAQEFSDILGTNCS